jgi:hypothetical protein
MSKRIPEEEVANFRKHNFSRKSSEDFLRSVHKSPRNYDEIYLSVAKVRGQDSSDELKMTELALAREAIREGCSYATEIDYTNVGIVAQGLVEKAESNGSSQ